MKPILFTLLLTLCSISSVFSQRFMVEGQVKDSTGGSLPSATAVLLKAADSTMTGFSVADKDGKFIIRNVAAGKYLLKVSFVGHISNTIPIETPASGEAINVGTVVLKEESKMLNAVKVEAERIPVLIKGDTIEYDALAFKAQANEVVEDLLKRMPGMEVESDGTVKAQGEEVRRVTVDGKEFFGRDPKMATKNLPADAVAKVQVFDRKSEQAQFSGIDDGVREKTINLELKEDRKSGAFGNISAGYGTDDRFETRLSLNRFNKRTQLSVLGMGNNINMQGFSVGEAMNFSGNSQRMVAGSNFQGGLGGNTGLPINFSGQSGSNGITTTWAGGINANHEISKKTEVNGSYFYNNTNTDVARTTSRENFLPTGTFNFDQESNQSTRNQNHRANVRVDHKLDSANSLLLTANSSLGQSNTFQETTSQTVLSNGSLQNSSDQLNTSESNSFNLNASLLWRHRFAKKGRTLSSELTFLNNTTERNGNLEATNLFFRGDIPTAQILSQRNLQENDNLNVGANFSLTEPLGKKRYLEANYRISRNQNSVNQQVFDIVSDGEELNNQLSNRFSSVYLYQRAGANLRVNRDKYNFTLGTGLQATNLKGDLELLNATIDRNFTNLLPVARFNYEFSNFKRMSADYETSVQEPNIQQLQPIVDNRDPLNLVVGNPDLRPSYRHGLRLSYNNFNPSTFFGMFAFVNAGYTTNAIVYSQTVDEFLVRTTRPVNVASNSNLNGNISLTFPITKLKSRINVGSNVGVQQGINLLNGVEQNVTNANYGGNIRYNFRYEDIIETNFGANLSRQLTNYEFTDANQAFFNQTYTADVNLNVLKNYRLRSNLRYLIFSEANTGFRQELPLLDLSIARSFLKNNSGELKITAKNLFNQNLGVTQRADVNFIETQVTNALGRFYMLTFTYSLNKALNPMERGRGRGPGMMIFGG